MLETQYFRRHEQWTANARFEEFVIELILHIVLEEHRSHINFSTCMSYAYCNETEVGQLHIVMVLTAQDILRLNVPMNNTYQSTS